jgi:hypothetical protein
VSALVSGSCIALVLLGGWGVAGIADNWLVGVAALLCFGVAWELRPRALTAPGQPLDPAAHPLTHRLVAEAAARVETRPPRAIHLSDGFGAGVVPTGYRGRPVLVLGAPALAALHDGGRRVLVELALAEVSSGALAQRFLPRTALSTLDVAEELLSPVDGERREFAVRSQNALAIGSIDSGTLNASTAAAGLIGRVLAFVPRALAGVLRSLLAADMRRARARARRRVVHASSEREVAAVEAALDPRVYAQALRASLTADGSVLAELRGADARSVTTRALDEELAPLTAPLDRRLRDRYRASLYGLA